MTAGQLLVSLAYRMSMIAVVAFVLTRHRGFRNLLRRSATLKEKLLLTVVFGAMGIAGTYAGIPMRGGAIANSRVIGPAVAGLLGGPWMGLGAGLLAGVHRYLLGGFTGFSCGVSTVVEAFLSGLLSRRVKQVDWKTGFLSGLAGESLQMGIILLLARPFSEAWELVRVIALPMTLVNAAGIAIFVSMIQAIRAEEEKIGALQTQKVLEIARCTLPHLRKGLDLYSAGAAARIVLELTGASAVAITDRERILAHVGRGEDHHRAGQAIMTAATRKVLREGRIGVAQTAREIGCSVEGCPLKAGVVVPLRCKDEVVGIVKLYHGREGAISPVDVEFVAGMSELLAIQLELSELERLAQLTVKAELKALRAQVNPHFLFNALNTIMSLCRTRPDRARELLGYLGEFFRRNLENAGDQVTLKEELEHVDAYLAIEQARFDGKLRVVKDIDPGLLGQPLPVLTLQPLVENAVKHGVLHRRRGGTVRISACVEEGALRVAVEDDGVGIPQETMELWKSGKLCSRCIGLSNVHERIRSLYGTQYGLHLESRRGEGTRALITVPLEPITRHPLPAQQRRAL